jgi:hypothetical protein
MHITQQQSLVDYFCATMFSLLSYRFDAINSFKPRRPQCPAYLFKAPHPSNAKKRAANMFFLFLCNNPSGAVARCEDCPIFSAAARAGGGASSTGCVAGLLSVRALAILRLIVWGLCAWVCVCRIWVCTLAFMIRIHANPCLHINWRMII